MGNVERGRVGLMLLALLAFLVAMTFNSMAGFGAVTGVFRQRTEDVMWKYRTALTPAAWSHFVWDFIYFWILAMFIYLLVGLCRRNPREWMYSSPAVFPYGFHISLILNLCLNVTWLIVFDREMLLPSLILSALMTCTEYMILFFSCRGLRVYGPWMTKYHTTDLWVIRILVQNGVAVYAAWSTFSTLLNLDIYLVYMTTTSKCDCAMLTLMLLLMELLAWFLLENFYLDRHVRYILTIYPVMILVSAGSVTNSSNPGSHMYIFTVLILATSCFMFVARVAIVTWRHLKQPLYSDGAVVMSPVEVALTERPIFL